MSDYGREYSIHLPRLASILVSTIAFLALSPAGSVIAKTPSLVPRPFSSTLYPTYPPPKAFPHANHRHLSCGVCHEGSTEPRSRKTEASPARCRTCHQKWGRKTGSRKSSKVNVPAKRGSRIRFSHLRHQRKQIPCASCHTLPARKRGKQWRPMSMPQMEICISCHIKRGIRHRCVTCHLSKKDGRLRTQFGATRLKPSGKMRGDAHTPLFAQNHAIAARTSAKYCGKCHTTSACLKCHARTHKPPRIHRGDYLRQHPLDVRLGRLSCKACHRSQTFCLSCHARSGVAQGSEDSAYRPKSSRTFHPPGFNTLRAGAKHHKHSARRNIQACTSCHRESECMSCHATTQRRGGGFSPHGRGFAKSAKCRALARANPRVCAKCHLSRDPQNGCR